MQPTTRGWINGLIGVAIFSGSLPATRAAVAGLDPLFLTFTRASIAGLLSLGLILALRQRWPARGDLLPLAVVSLGVVVGFPLMTALALRGVSAAHALVVVGLLPLSTALFGVLRAGDRPRPAFWLFAAVGSAIVGAYALAGAPGGVSGHDGFLLVGVVVCGLGYAEGGRLSRRLGGWQVICWALVLSLPAMLPLALATAPADWQGVDRPVLFGLAYVSLFSMLIGFIFWYRGLAEGGVAAVGQIQLLQPFLGLGVAALLLHEPVSASMLAATAAVLACVVGARRSALR